MLNLMTIVGARPQFIKAAPLSILLREKWNEILVHTGQHYDQNMSEVFFCELGIPIPDHNLGVGSGGHGWQTGNILRKTEKILLKEKPDAVIVYGDTNSTLAGALAASKLHIPVIHIEAGLRSYNKLMPEEQNRVLTDHISTLLLCPTLTAVDNLAREGITDGVHFTGDIMFDAVLKFYNLAEHRYGDGRWLEEIAEKSNGNLLGISSRDYYLATIHRAENTDNRQKLQDIFTAFGELDKPVVVPMHPRTRHRLAGSPVRLPKNVLVLEPVGYLLMLYLIANAHMVLTDSGGVQKEAYFLKTPCTTLRNETEWVETLENEWNVLSPIDVQSIVETATRSRKCLKYQQQMHFGDGHAAEEIVTKIEERLSL